MNELVIALRGVSDVARVAVLVAALACAGLAALDWAVRTRRLSPFGALSRFTRRRIDPLFAPVERRLVRAGMSPVHAPWWGTLGVIVLGLLLFVLLDFAIALVAQAAFAAQAPASVKVRLVIAWAIGLVQVALFVRVITSWLSVSPHARWVRWSYWLTEWLLGPIRRVLPTFGMIDLSPIVAYLALVLLKAVIL
ncbi:MAG TPA: YggT family protein [Gemmatimonadaceae bacterium]|nr:YggT family protein [Gemmatimonadaceae bacterium]